MKISDHIKQIESTFSMRSDSMQTLVEYRKLFDRVTKHIDDLDIDELEKVAAEEPTNA